MLPDYGAKELCFSLEEYRGRLSAVQKQMSKRGVDLLLVHTPENIFYVSGHNTPGYSAYQCLLIPAAGDPTLLLRNGEVGNAKVYSWVDDLETYFDGSDHIITTKAAIKKLGLPRQSRIAAELDSWFLTPRIYMGLEAALPEYEWCDGAGSVEACRLIKSEQEIDYIRRACRTAEAGMAAAIDAVEEGKTDNDVAAALHYAMITAGSEYPAYGPFVALGRRSSIMHGIWGRQIIRAGNTFILEIGGVYHRYNGALMRGVSVGKPSKQVEAMAEASDAANSAVIDGMAPGATTADLHGRSVKELEKRGFGGARKGRRCGYGIGIAYWPDWGEGHFLSMIDEPNTTLVAGMVLHLPLSIRDPGNCGVGYSETVAVTSTGYEKLTNFERRLFIK